MLWSSRLNALQKYLSVSLARLFIAGNLNTLFKRYYFKNLEANWITKLEALLRVGMPAKAFCRAF